MATKVTKPNLFDFEDYREFLQAWYDFKKQTEKKFSYREFSKRAGLNTSNFLMLVMQGKRNLTTRSLLQIVKGLALNKQEQEFFELLVRFNQAKSSEEKQHHFAKLIQSRKFQNLKSLEKKEYDYYAEWYHPVVRELVASPDFDGSPEWLAARLHPKVSVAKCQKSLQLLLDLGLIQESNNGFVQTNPVVSTGPKIRSLVVHNYHKTVLKLSQHLLNQDNIAHHDVSSLTLGIKAERLPELIDKIGKFRKELLQWVSEDPAEEVVQVNFQMYPLTKTSERSPR